MKDPDQYAAFIMTFRRSEILTDTIQKLLDQTKPPSRILIVDNDPQRSALLVANSFSSNQVGYHATGYNSGPAGAAYYGLEILFEEGWHWVLWMDDNDPPKFPDVMENIFKIPGYYKSPEKIGMLGAVGVWFDKKKAKTIRVPDYKLSGIIEVDNVAGNMLPVVHRRVFEKNVWPDKDLFFGFEELDFSLAIKRQGLSVLVSGEELRRHRENAGRMNLNRGLYKVKNIKNLWREYYSIRNVMYILRYKEKEILGALVLTAKSLGKSIIGFRYGWQYGTINMKFIISGLKDGLRGNLGYRNFS
jgi:GT2 family glycosyltransferase